MTITDKASRPKTLSLVGRSEAAAGALLLAASILLSVLSDADPVIELKGLLGLSPLLLGITGSLLVVAGGNVLANGIPLAFAGNLVRVMMAVTLIAALPATARAEELPPLATVKALRLETAKVARIALYFAPADREHAKRFAALAENAAGYFDHELGASFPLRLAVLTPEDWFVPYAGGDTEPYGIPWASVEDLLIVVPASLEEGVLIFGPDEPANLRRVRFVLLHEFGHIASKKHLHPASPIDEEH